MIRMCAKTTRFMPLLRDTISADNALATLIDQLEQDPSLNEPRHLRQRVQALDDLDAHLGDRQHIRTELHQRARVIYAELESANFKLFQAIRQDIQRGSGGRSVLEWMPDLNGPANLINCTGYEYLDELISGVLPFEEPSAEVLLLESEMVAYKPTPARH